MKSFLAIAAAIGAVAASSHHAHEEFHKRWPAPSYFQPECCQNIVTVTVYGTMSPSPVSQMPTPMVTTCPTPGVYTIPAATITIYQTTTVVAQTTTTLTPGASCYGGSSTSVAGPTTITGGYVTVTSIIATTTYVCPSAGSYTVVAPTTTTVCSASTVVVYPVPATITPGTYTRPATTITVTETDYVYVCPYTQVTSTTVAYSVVTVQPSQPAQSVTSPSTPSGGNGCSASMGSNGNLWAVSYNQYTAGGQCKSSGEVDSDISLIASKGFASVRIYGTDCAGLQNVGASCKAHGLKLIVGVFIDGSGMSGAQAQVDEIVAWGKGGYWGIVELIVIGNESIFNGFISAGSLAGLIGSAKSAFSGAGYCGPVTTTEPLGSLQSNGGSLCGVIDVVAGNLQPFFNSDVTAANAGSFIASELAAVQAVCPGKPAFNLECGWPSQGSSNGAAIASPSDQAAAMKSIVGAVGGKTVVFSFANDMWKNPGPYNVEQYFGCMEIF